MLARVSSYAPLGIEGRIITVEVDLRRGIPGIDVVGLPDVAVREAKERVRVAIRNSGFRFPTQRILVNLSPAGIRKVGAGYDLPMALAILAAAEQLPAATLAQTLILGELNLSGEVKAVKGVLAAVGAGLEAGIGDFLVPAANLREACVLNRGNVMGAGNLQEVVSALREGGLAGAVPERQPLLPDEGEACSGDLADIKGHARLKRALEVSAAGRHHLFLFGAPGCGKTMAALRLPSLLPPLSREQALLVTKIHSLAGVLPQDGGLVSQPPFRMPHHSATREGMLGGGRNPGPGEVSLAHEGVLFLDEAPEFRKNLLQGLREPIERARVTIARAESKVWYPAGFQLVMAANPCPCGNLGRNDKVCICTTREVHGYWKKVGGALLDRIDIRVPVEVVSPGEMVGEKGLSSAFIRERVAGARQRQSERFRTESFATNSAIPPGLIEKYCALDAKCSATLARAVRKLGISSRAFHSILRLARTIADLGEAREIKEEHLLEAIQHRRYGDGDYYWSTG